jgi:tRNA threonylcarbamoyladenosine modification (KEOPS) complex Cgi121 subunit
LLRHNNDLNVCVLPVSDIHAIKVACNQLRNTILRFKEDEEDEEENENENEEAEDSVGNVSGSDDDSNWS